MKKLYLLGHPVSHSLSPIMQNEALKSLGLEGEWDYEAHAVSAEDLPAKLKQLEEDKDVIGCNVTVPHKMAVYEWLGRGRIQKLDALNACAVNTLYREGDHFLGDSTDFRGALMALKSEGFGLNQPDAELDLRQWDIAVIGTGGSAQTIVAGLASLECVKRVMIFGRSMAKASAISNTVQVLSSRVSNAGEQAYCAEIGFRALDTFAAWNVGRKSIVIQTTTVGMATGENPGQSPVPSGSVKSGQIAFDLVYKPHNTRFLLEAKAHGATLVHGINMLVGQGALSLQQWIEASAEPSVRERFDLFETMATMRTALGV